MVALLTPRHRRPGAAHHHFDQRDHANARRIASAAGQALLALRSNFPASGTFDELKRCGDKTSHALIVALLRETYPDDPILSEEGRDDDDRLGSSRVWIVDPLDGTREFAEGRSDWAVHVALVVDGRPVVGAVALPSLDTTFATDWPPHVSARSDIHPKILVSRSRKPAFTARLADALDGEVVEMGSAGAKSMAVVRGAGVIYVHAGGQYEWDSAAPVAVALASGLHVSRLDGSPLEYNRPDPWLPDQIVCRPEIAGLALEALAASAEGV